MYAYSTSTHSDLQCACVYTDEGLGNISSQFAIGFGSFVDKIAYPFASTLQNGSDYITFHLSRKRYIQCTVRTRSRYIILSL